MTGKRSKRVNSALVSVGMVALIAGCGGGSAVSNSNGSTTYIPPSKQMATATLSLVVPGRRPSAGRRSPRYVSPYTSRVDVAAVSAGAPSPWPIATSTSIPTPGPVPEGATPSPIPVTMQVPVAVGSAQFSVNTYDSGGYLLSGLVSGPVTIAPNTANNVNLVLNAAADCVEINHVTGGSFVMTPLENQAGVQTSTFTVTPCDADGYPIPSGQSLGNAITFATPAPVQLVVNSGSRKRMAASPTPTPATQLTFSPNVITAGGDTLVTVTYPQGTNAVYQQQAVPQPLPSALYGGYASITADPVYLVMVANNNDNNVSVFEKSMQGTLPFNSLGTTIPTITTPESIIGDSSMHGCAQAGQAVVLGLYGATVFTEPAGTAANPVPTPVGSTPSGNGNFNPVVNYNPSLPGMDMSCNVYIGDANGYVSTLTAQMTNFALQQYGGNFNTNGTGPASIVASAWVNGVPYVGLDDTPGGYMGALAPNNIVSVLTGADQGVAPHAVAMSRLNSTSLVVAYEPSGPGSDFSMAQWTPGGSLSGIATLPGSSSGLTNLAVDPSGEVWTAAKGCLGGPQSLYKYDPASNTVTTYSIGSGCSISPSSIAAAPDGTLYVVDDGDQSSGHLDFFSWQNVTGGAPATFDATPIASPVPLGNNPIGVTIFP